MSDSKSAASSVRERAMAVVTIIAMSIFYYSFWHTPKKGAIAKQASALTEAMKKQESTEALLKSLSSGTPNTDKSAGDKSSRITLIRQANNNFSNIVQTLSGAGSKESFVIQNLTAEKEETFSEYSKVLFNLEVDAPFLSVGKFLEKIEKSDLLTELVSIEATRIDPELKRCTIKLKLYSYASRL